MHNCIVTHMHAHIAAHTGTDGQSRPAVRVMWGQECHMGAAAPPTYAHLLLPPCVAQVPAPILLLPPCNPLIAVVVVAPLLLLPLRQFQQPLCWTGPQPALTQDCTDAITATACPSLLLPVHPCYCMFTPFYCMFTPATACLPLLLHVLPCYCMFNPATAAVLPLQVYKHPGHSVLIDIHGRVIVRPTFSENAVMLGCVWEDGARVSWLS